MYKHFSKEITTIIGLVMALLFAPQAAASSLDNLANALAKMRGEVEELQTQLDAQKEMHGSRITSLSSQLADLSVEERRQKTSIEKLEHSIEKMTADSRQAEQSGEELKPVLFEILANFKRHIVTGFPFKVKDRLKAIEEIENNLNNQLVDPNKAINQTWALIEDEIRLSKENGLYQQTILLDGESVLVDIAKLGSVFLYFQTRDNRAGMAKRSAGGWKFETADASSDIAQIAKLFDALKKQIRQGFFELPNPLKQ
ncbi:MAG: DUF3450 domain-containing protein [Nitrosomonas sp.]|nr:DUF3450 domain-containing protein [Nitrosomonas sp.]